MFDVLEEEDRDDEKETEEDDDEQEEDEYVEDRERDRDSDKDLRLAFNRLLVLLIFIEEDIIDVDSKEVLFASVEEYPSSLLTCCSSLEMVSTSLTPWLVLIPPLP